MIILPGESRASTRKAVTTVRKSQKEKENAMKYDIISILTAIRIINRMANSKQDVEEAINEILREVKEKEKAPH